MRSVDIEPDWMTLRDLIHRRFDHPEVALCMLQAQRLQLWLQTSAVGAEVQRGVERQLAQLGLHLPVVLMNATPTTAQHEPEAEDLFTQTAALIAGIWAQILAVDEIEHTHEFFDLGGHSLLAVQCVAELHACLQVEVPVKWLFDEPQLGRFTQQVMTLLQPASPASIEVTTEEVVTQTPTLSPAAALALRRQQVDYPLSPAQARLWFLTQLKPEDIAYNVPVAIKITGFIDPAALALALAQVMQRHEVFRLCCYATDAGPRQQLQADWQAQVAVQDLTDENPKNAEKIAREKVQAMAELPFDVSVALARVAVYRIEQNVVILSLVLHHIITDAWSMNVLMQETMRVYTQGLDALPPMAFDYLDYAQWQHELLASEQLVRQKAYWVEQLAEVPHLELPTDFGRSHTLAGSGKTLRQRLGLSMQKIRALLKQLKLTEFQFFLAALFLLLHRYSGQQDVTVGSPVAGRYRKDYQNTIGLFVNTLVFRSRLDDDNESMGEYFQRMKTLMVAAMDNQDLPFEVLVDALNLTRDLHQAPLFQVLFTYQTESVQARSSVYQIEALPVQTSTSKFDWFFSLQPQGDDVWLSVEYNDTLYDEVTVNRYIKAYKCLLRHLLAHGQRLDDVALHDLSLLDQTKQQILQDGWQYQPATHAFIPCTQRFEDPGDDGEAIAIKGPMGQISYRALHIRTDVIAQNLLALKITGPIALYLPRSEAWVLAIIGVLKAGHAYVPISQDDPPARVEFIVADAGIGCVLVQDDSAAIDGCAASTVTLAQLEQTSASTPTQKPMALPRLLPQDPAYILYTSGSTGQAKGVMMTHQALSNLLSWQLAHSRCEPGQMTLGFAPYQFDVSFQELFTTLAQGGIFWVLSEPVKQDLLQVAQLLLVHDIQRLFVPYVALQQLALVFQHLQDYPTALREVITAGEALQSTPEIRHWFGQRPNTHLINQYGPTETHVVSAFRLGPDAEQWADLPPIGQPIDNARLYVLDEALTWMPEGAVGELMVGGPMLAQGYTQADLSAERFVPNPWLPNERLYRTGDWVKINYQQQLEYVGRRDDQVKVRGYRVELAEIETRLNQHPGVEQAVVLVAEDCLLAYWQGQVGIEHTLIEVLSACLPQYMVPTHWQHVLSMPLTQTGKIDRRGLPPISLQTPSIQAAEGLQTVMETELAMVWQRCLKRDQIDRNAHFFQLGGHSLIATQMVLQVKQALDLEVPVRHIFEHPRLQDFALCCEHLHDQNAAIDPSQTPEPWITAYAQQRLWFIDQWNPGGNAYHLGHVLQLKGEVDIAQLQQRLERMIDRHEILRTTYEQSEDAVYQVVQARVPEQVRVLHQATLSPTQQLAQHRFELAQGPLFYAWLYPQDDGCLLLLHMHHILADGWSMGLFSRELSQPTALPALRIQYKDYAYWQRQWIGSADYAQQLAYWQTTLAAVEPIHFPFWVGRQGDLQQGDSCHWVLPEAIRQQLKVASQAYQVSEFMWLLTCLKGLLYHYTQQTKLAIGVPTAGRGHSDTADLIGLFVNMQAIRADFAPTDTFATVLQGVQDALFAAQQHQDVPFEHIVEVLALDRDSRQSPLFQVGATYLSLQEAALSLPGVRVEALAVEHQTAKFELSLNVLVDEAQMALAFEYQTGLFDADFIQQLMQHFTQILVLSCQASGEPIQRIVSPKSSDVLAAYPWAQTHERVESGRHVLSGFERQVERQPHAIAVEMGDTQWTYAELDQQARQIAHWLQMHQVQPGDRVGICLPRCLDLIACLLGIWRSGAAYVPIDPAAPPARVAKLLADCEPVLVMVDAAYRAHMPDTLPVVEWPAAVLGEPAETTPLTVTRTAEDLAYILYTSGSTGQPKGVAVTDRAIVRLLHEPNFIPAVVAAESRFGQYAAVSFDAATFEIWMPLYHGGTLCLLPPGVLSLAQMGAALCHQAIDVMWFTAPLFHQMVDFQLAQMRGLKYVLAGGDALSKQHVLKALAGLPETRLVNGYGPTENTTFTCCCQLNEADLSAAQVPIGQPIQDTNVVLVDPDMNPVAAGAIGELITSGEGLAQGYWRAPELTDARFITLDIGVNQTDRWYRTGDLAYQDHTGALVFVGRVDHQVKFRGFRVELSEIESLIQLCPSIAACVVLLRGAAEAEQLVAYVQPREWDAFVLAEVQISLKNQLPSYMQPSQWVLMPAFALTTQGKIARDDLPEPAPQDNACMPPETSMEEQLLVLWQQVLPAAVFGVEDNFFALGGHSLMATRLLALVNDAFQVALEIRSLFEYATVRTLAHHLKALSVVQMQPMLRVSRQAEHPLSYSQMRFWMLQQIEPHAVAYQIPFALHLHGAVSVARLQTAYACVLQQFEILRTVYRQAGEGVTQHILASAESMAMQRVVCTEAEAQTQMQACIAQPLDLTVAPIAAYVYVLPEPQHVIFFMHVHHIAFDAGCIGLFFEALSRHYMTPHGGDIEDEHEDQDDTCLHYLDYVYWQRATVTPKRLDQDIRAWTQVLQDYPALDLPYDKIIPKTLSSAGESVPIVLDAASTEGLKRLAGTLGLTPFMLLLGLLQQVIARWTRQSRFVIGTPVSGRLQSQTEALMGCFVNTAVVPLEWQAQRSLGDALKAAKEQILNSFSQQHIPFEQLVQVLADERNTAQSPIFQVMFSLVHAPTEEVLPGVEVTPINFATHTSKVELSVDLIDFGSHISGVIEYNSDLFLADTMASLAAQLVFLVNQVDSAMKVPLAQLPLADLPEMALAEAGTFTLMDNVLDIWQATVARYAQRTAITWQDAGTNEETALTYRALDEWSAALTHVVDTWETEVVALWLPRRVETVVLMLALLKVGKAFLPLDRDLPVARVQTILNDAQCPLVIVEQAHAGLKQKQIGLAALVPAEEGQEDHVMCRDVHRTAYIIYTSGSTGTPKGVMVTRGNLSYYLDEAKRLYQLQCEDRVLQFSSLSFDASIEEIFPTLWSGACLVLRADDMLDSGEAFFTRLAAHKISVCSLPTAFWRTMTQQAMEYKLTLHAELRLLIIGGENADALSVRRWQKLTDERVQLINTYGPTETTVITTAADITHLRVSDVDQVPIGLPLSKTSAWVLDAAGHPVADEMIGELWILGPNVASGYYRAPKLSRQRFHEIGYRTGDLVKRRQDQQLVFVGRLDAQVKFRGYRIEPRDIEAVIEQNQSILRAVVRLQTDALEQLIAWYLPQPEHSVNLEAVKAHVRAQLPDYMQPSAWVALDTLPLTPGGKVDVKGLPNAFEYATPAEHAEHWQPHDVIETELKHIWLTVLNVPVFQANDNFFHLGGHSLLAIQLIGQVHSRLNSRMVLKQVFEHPTFLDMAQLIRSMTPVAESTDVLQTWLLQPAPTVYPAAFAQVRLWLLQQLDTRSTAYHMPMGVRIQQSLNAVAVTESVHRLMMRHDALCTSYTNVSGQIQAQRLEANLIRQNPIQWREVADLDDPAVMASIERFIQTPFDLSTAPLLRVLVVNTAQAAMLVFNLHHIIADGWSLEILWREFAMIYRTLTEHSACRLPPPMVYYHHYCRWSQAQSDSGQLAQQLAYWEAQLADLSVVSLATRRASVQGQDAAGLYRWQIPQAQVAGLLDLAKTHGFSDYMALLSGFAILIQHYSQYDDIPIGTPMAGRSRHAWEHVVGLFVNTLVIRADVSADPSILALLERTKKTVLGAFEHQDAPYEQVVQALHPSRDIAHNPLFSLVFSMDHAAFSTASAGADAFETLPLSNQQAKFELSLFVSRHDGGLDCVLEYQQARFEPEMMAQLAGHYGRVLAQMSEPDRHVSDIRVLASAEYDALVASWQLPSATPPSLLQVFQQQVDTAADAVALQTEKVKWSYTQLNQRANQWANHLQRSGVQADDRVALALPRSCEWVALVLAVLKVGATYVPIDTHYPAARIHFMLTQTAPSLTLLSASDPIAASGHTQILEEQILDDMSTTFVAPAAPHGAQPAYIMYTSGSTGEPKGVVVTQAGVVRLAQKQAYLQVQPQDVFLGNAPLAFDASTFELWGALLNGARVALMPPALPSLHDLAAAIQDYRVTVLWLTAPLFLHMVERELAALQGVRCLIAGGDVLSAPHVRKIQQTYPALTLVNGYGPTENTTFTCCHVVDLAHDTGAIPIGYPLAGSTAYVLNAWRQPVPQGAVGYLYSGGWGVAQGYWQQPELTDQVFFDDPFITYGPGKMLNTQDMVRMLPTGALQFLGRRDHQVKLRGFRVELAEVEQQAVQFSGVDAAVAVVHGQAAEQQTLSLYVVAQDRVLSALREHLRAVLPGYMCPDHLLTLVALPMTPAGKVDRKQLPAPVEDAPSVGAVAGTATQKVLCQLWAEVLCVAHAHSDSDFFALGGHSLLAIQLVARIQETLGWQVPLPFIWQAPTPAALEHIALTELTEVAAVPALSVSPVQADYPLSFAQERLWFLHQLDPHNPVFNIPFVVNIQGALVASALQQAFDAVYQRHVSLRLRFIPTEQGARMHIAPYTAGILKIREYTETLLPALTAESARGFDLQNGPVFRAMLWQTPTATVLQMTLHHIISDGWSMTLLVEELKAYYAQALQGPIDVRMPEFQYPDYVLWQRRWFDGTVLEAQLAYWVETLHGCPEQLRMPTDFPRPAIQRFVGDHHLFALSPELTQSMHAFALTQGVTLYMLSMACWQLLLSQYARQTDICVGSPIAGRPVLALENMLGMFVNAGVVRTDCSHNPSFIQLLAQVKGNILGAFAHQDLPAEKVIDALGVKRALDYAPIAQYALAFQNLPEVSADTAQTDLQFEPIVFNQGTSKYDMTLALVEVAGQLQGEIEFNTDLFKPSSIERLARHWQALIETVLADPTQPIDSIPLLRGDELLAALGLQPASTDQLYPLTSTQRDLYLDGVLKADNQHQCLGGAIDIHQTLDLALWQSVSQTLVDHYPLYRAGIRGSQQAYTDPAYLWIEKNRRVQWEIFDWAEDDEDGLHSLLHEIIYTPYDLTEEVPYRAILIRFSSQHYRAVIGTHHILGDGVSGALFLAHLGAYYQTCAQALAAGSVAPAPVVQDQWLDYVKHHRATFDRFETLQYWQTEFSSVEPLSLPVHSRAPGLCTQKHRFTAAEWKSIRRYCRALSISPAILFKALFAVSLQVLAQPSRDFMFYEIMDGRPLDWRTSIGCFFQQLPVIIKLDQLAPDQSIADFLSGLRQYLKSVGECQHISMMQQQKLLDPGPVKFYYNYYHFPAQVTFMGQKEAIVQYPPIPEADQVYFIVNAGLAEPELVLHYDAPVLGDYPFIERMVSFLSQWQGQCRHFAELQMVLPKERALIERMNDTAHDFGVVPVLHQLIEAQVRRNPQAIALVCAQQSVTYAELDAGANQIAQRLQRSGVTPGAMVGVHLLRSVHMVMALLGVLKAGAAYLPLDADYPLDRLQYMAKDAEIKAILSDQALPATWHAVADVIVLPEDTQDMPKQALDVLVRTDHLAYVMYTSGSTGQPKGVMIQHDSIVNRLLWMQAAYELTPADKVLQKTPYSFDVSVWEFFWPLMVGAQVVMAKPEGHKAAHYLVELIQAEHISTLHFVPSMLSVFLDETDVQACDTLKHIFVSGEALPRAVQNRCLQVFPGVGLHNLYGPTEAAVDVSYWPCVKQTHGEVPIGTPIANTQLVVLDTRLALLPPGVSGELYIGGVNLAQGYLKQPELTQAHFIYQTIFAQTPTRWYKTGDLARITSTGVVEYLGRLDHQVKLRGLRVELGEIETQLQRLSNAQAVVLVDDDRLLACLQQTEMAEEDGPTQTETALKAALATMLPPFMLPHRIHWVATLPLSKNGKLDRVALLKQVQADSTTQAYVAPSTAIEQHLVAIWESVLNRQPIGVRDNFFQLGGHSLLTIQLIQRIRQDFPQDIQLTELFQYPTIETLARLLDTTESAPGSVLQLLKAPDNNTRPGAVFCVHGIGGSSLPFMPLSDILGLQRPFYALEAVGLYTGEIALESIEQIARRYCQAIQAQQAQGPYALMGHSFGGLIAYEMARQLQQAGQKIESLVLLETASPVYLAAEYQGTDSAAQEQQALNTWAQGLATEYGLAVDVAAFVQDPLGSIAAVAQQLPESEQDSVLLYGIKLQYVHMKAMQTYHAQPYPGPVTLVVAGETVGHTDGWEGFVQTLSVHQVPGDHDSLLTLPLVRALGRVLLALGAE